MTISLQQPLLTVKRMGTIVPSKVAFESHLSFHSIFKVYPTNLPIAVKAVILIAALGLLSIAANWFCLQRLDEIDRLNAIVTRHFAPARLALAKAKAAIESFGIATYKI